MLAPGEIGAPDSAIFSHLLHNTNDKRTNYKDGDEAE
jgi:hypothetical protein